VSGRIRVAPAADRTLDGITFASKAEMNRYAELKMLEQQIVEFVKGKRLQMALPFDQSPEERKLTREFGKVFAGEIGRETEGAEAARA
jgi:hypothetical protein